MKGKKMLAKIIAAVSLKMAKASCGAASYFGAYEPKYPDALKKFKR